MDLQAQIDCNTIIVGEFSTTLSLIDRSSIQKNSQRCIDKFDLTDIYRIFHPPTAQYTFFSADHRMLSKIDNILGHKKSLKNIKLI
jgi:hypothetical protein